MAASTRSGDSDVVWHLGPWPMTVADVLAVEAAAYGARVECWARSVRQTLDSKLDQGAAGRSDD